MHKLIDYPLRQVPRLRHEESLISITIVVLLLQSFRLSGQQLVSLSMAAKGCRFAFSARVGLVVQHR